MKPVILLVDDQRDILRLLHSTLDTLGQKFEILEAPSGEEALLASSRHKIDLLVSDYMLPGMSGVELMRKVQVKHPEVKTILVTGMTERKARDEMLKAGAVALFDKPIPLADFLDAVERSLGLVSTIFPPEKTEPKDVAQQARLSDVLANYRQSIKAQAVFLVNDRGRVMARAGNLNDSSMEVSIVSAIASLHATSLKLAKFNHQDELNSYHVFLGGDHDLLFIPVSASYILLLAGDGLASEANILNNAKSMMIVREEIEKSLKSLMGMADAAAAPQSKDVSATTPVKSVPIVIPQPTQKMSAEELAATPPAADLEALLTGAIERKTIPQNTASFWDDAAEKIGNKPLKSDVISYEEALKRGLTSDGQI